MEGFCQCNCGRKTSIGPDGIPNAFIRGHSTRAYVENPVIDGQRMCMRCRITKPVSEFYKRPETASGYRGVCRDCMRPMNNVRVKRYYHKHLDRAEEYGRRRSLRRHGLTKREYVAYVEQQGNRCAIWRTAEPGGHGRWHIDHCHETGVIRGLLCSPCNLGLGQFRDTPEFLIAAAEYLRKRSNVGPAESGPARSS